MRIYVSTPFGSLKDVGNNRDQLLKYMSVSRRKMSGSFERSSGVLYARGMCVSFLVGLIQFKQMMPSSVKYLTRAERKEVISRNGSRAHCYMLLHTHK